jgi:SHS2 domain-containing protein
MIYIKKTMKKAFFLLEELFDVKIKQEGKMAKKFEYLEHLSDTGIRFFGDNIEELFENAARGMFSVISDLDSIRPLQKKKLIVVSEGNSVEDLLVLWLERLLFHHEVDKMLFSGFKVSSLNKHKKGYQLSAIIYGEKIDHGRHRIKTGIKAPTYHQLKVEKQDNKWQGRTIFDI